MTKLAAAAYQPDLVAAWKEACDLIANQKVVDYVLVTSFGNAWEGTADQRSALDKAAKAARAETPSSVASMLLPNIVRTSTQAPSDAIEAAQKMLGRGRRKGLSYSGWRHTYFERLTGAWYNRRGTKETISQNRLLKTIEKINEWKKTRRQFSTFIQISIRIIFAHEEVRVYNTCNLEFLAPVIYLWWDYIALTTTQTKHSEISSGYMILEFSWLAEQAELSSERMCSP